MTSVYLDEIVSGMSAAIEHTVTERDIQLFGEATGDLNPVHFDEEFARKTVFRGRVAHGALSIGFISALIGTKLPGMGRDRHDTSRCGMFSDCSISDFESCNGHAIQQRCHVSIMVVVDSTNERTDTKTNCDLISLR